eukprot:PhF_6_TR9431/c0_g1_i1/m.14743
MFGKKRKEVEAPPPKYKYGGDDAKETDDFINAITSNVPKHEPTESTPFVTNQIQTFLTEERERSLGYSGQCYRILLTIFNLLFLLGGLAGTGGVVYLMLAKDTFLTVCTQCKNLLPMFIAASLVVALVGIIGLCATKKRNKCLILLYNFFQVLIFLLFLGWLIAVVVARTNVFNKYIADGWDDTVQSDPSSICDIQRTLKCSGWDTTCGNGTIPPNVTHSPSGPTASPTSGPSTQTPTSTPTQGPTDTPTPPPTVPPTSAPTDAPTASP